MSQSWNSRGRSGRVVLDFLLGFDWLESESVMVGPSDCFLGKGVGVLWTEWGGSDTGVK